MLESQSIAINKANSRVVEVLGRRLREVAVRESIKHELKAEVSSVCTSELGSARREIPFLPLLASAMPTQWTRTGLFSNIKKGERRILVNETLEGRSDCRVRISGEELDMYDNDVFLHVVQLAQGMAAGEPIYFERLAFLKAIGRNDSSRDYNHLQESVERLASTTIFIDGQRGGESFRLIDKLKWGDGLYWIMMDPLVVSIFESGYLAFIDMEVRLRLKSPLAKYLQNYVVGHAVGDHRIGLESLRLWSGSRGRVRDFKSRALPPALKELEIAGVIQNWEIDETVVRWTRLAHSKSKRRV